MTGTRTGQPLNCIQKPIPDGFGETFIRFGWRGVEVFFGSRTSCNKRWIIQAGGEDLLAARRRYRDALPPCAGPMLVPLDQSIYAAMFARQSLCVVLTDGRTITAPIEWFPLLFAASPELRDQWKISTCGLAIEWPKLGERVSVDFLLAKRPSAVSPPIPR